MVSAHLVKRRLCLGKCVCSSIPSSNHREGIRTTSTCAAGDIGSTSPIRRIHIVSATVDTLDWVAVTIQNAPITVNLDTVAVGSRNTVGSR